MDPLGRYGIFGFGLFSAGRDLDSLLRASRLLATTTTRSPPALEFDPKYIKALQRRAAANEAIGSWSSLTAAQEGQLARAVCTRSWQLT
jgi:hypothetical protein